MELANQVFITTFLDIALGYLLKHFNIILEADAKIISKFLMYTTFPGLMFVTTLNAKLDSTLFYIPILYILSFAIMLACVWLYLRQYQQQTRGVLLFAFGALNIGMFGFPLIEGLFGKEYLKYAIMCDIGNTLFGFGVIYPIAKRLSIDGREVSAKAIARKVISLPPFMAMVLGLSMNLIEVRPPQILENFASVLAQGNKPIGLLLLGLFLSFKLDRSQFGMIMKTTLIRISFGVLMAVIVFWFVPAGMKRNILMICAIMPMGLTALPFSVELQFDTRIAGMMVNVSLVLGFLMIWALVVGLKMV